MASRMIYSVGAAEGFQIAEIAEVLDLLDQLRDRNGAPFGGSWSPRTTTLHAVNRGKRLAVPDAFCSGGTPRLVFTAGAARSMQDVLAANGELLPLLSSHPEGLLLHNTRVIDCLDLEQSEVRRFRDSDKVMAVLRPVLRADMIGDADMFIIPQEPIRTLVSSAFVQRAESQGLNGLSFRPYFDGQTPYFVGFNPSTGT